MLRSSKFFGQTGHLDNEPALIDGIEPSGAAISANTYKFSRFPIQIVFPSTRLLSAKVRAFVDLVVKPATGSSSNSDHTERIDISILKQ